MKKLWLNLIILFLCVSCGDSDSEYYYCIDNKTKYEIVLYFPKQSLEEIETIFLPPNKETIIFQHYVHSPKKLSCTPPNFLLESYTYLVVDDDIKHLTKDIFDDNNWECKGNKKRSFIMVGSYYDDIKSIFIITEDDLE